MAKSAATYSVLSPGCPSRIVLERIADKWTALIIQILSEGELRYSALHRRIGDISQKVLTQTLRSLERDGLVRRKVYGGAPPKVEYSLTALGRTLIEPLQGLCRWTEKHLAEMEAHRREAEANGAQRSESRSAAIAGDRARRAAF
ncbi:MAG TPA: helix-turn-helix domain-containing protein [Chthoniobacterales bacterium]